MKTLFFDTATQKEYLALNVDGTIHAHIDTGEKSHSSTIFARIDALLKTGGISIIDIDALAVGIGPGSFTGLRIGITTARMLAQQICCPIVGISSTLVHSFLADYQDCGYLTVAFDAKKSRVFGATYKISDKTLEKQPIIPDGDYPLLNLLTPLPKGSRVLSIGDGFSVYDAGTADVELVEGSKITLNPKDLMTHIDKIVSEREGHGCDFNSILPNYSRLSDAEMGAQKGG